MLRQKFVRWSAIIYMYQLLLLAAFTFLKIADMPIFSTFRDHTNIFLTGLDFSIFSLIAALAIPLIVFIPDKHIYFKRFFYVICGLPFAAFTVPYGYYLLLTGVFNLAVVVYIEIYFSFLVIAGASFRSSR
jgi:hypothetical protein